MFALVIVVGIGILCGANLHSNDIQNLQVVQSVDGDVTIRRSGGWYVMFWPEIWTYPKASVEICSDRDKDAIEMQFSNKSKGWLNCQIGYRIDSTDDAQILRLHQQVEGSDEKIWHKVRTTLQTVAQCVASQYTPSESVEKFPEFAKNIRDKVLHEPQLMNEGIDIVSFTCGGLPRYDDDTNKQFAKQKEADLAKRLAEAEKLKLESEKMKVEANYAMQISEQRGKAEAEMANAVQAAEKEKRLAEIAAQKKVAVQELEKQEMLIKAQKEKEVAAIEVEKQKEVAKIQAEKEREVAEVAKLTEKENLERVQLVAQQQIAKAEAKKKAIELAGDITEAERVRLEIEKNTKIECARAWANGIGKVKFPTIMSSNNGNGTVGPADAINTFFDLKNAAMAIELAEREEKVDAPKPAPAAPVAAPKPAPQANNQKPAAPGHNNVKK